MIQEERQIIQASISSNSYGDLTTKVISNIDFLFLTQLAHGNLIRLDIYTPIKLLLEMSWLIIANSFLVPTVTTPNLSTPTECFPHSGKHLSAFGLFLSRLCSVLEFPLFFLLSSTPVYKYTSLFNYTAADGHLECLGGCVRTRAPI